MLDENGHKIPFSLHFWTSGKSLEKGTLFFAFFAKYGLLYNIYYGTGIEEKDLNILIFFLILI